jgi:ribosomal protein S6--L-glutamate ligase
LAARGVGTDVICPQSCLFDPAHGVLAQEGQQECADLVCAEDCLFDPARSVLQRAGGPECELAHYDGIVSRTRDALGLAILARAEADGILTINTYSATQQVRDKARMAIALSQAGVPCAPTVLADHISVLAGLPRDYFPLILKATFGDNSQGLRLVRRPEDLDGIHWGDSLVLAQHYLVNDGFDLKLYVCGQHVHAVRKPSPFNGDPRATAQPVEPTPRMVELALQCGEIFGLDIYGVDTIETRDGPVVIEVNEFPNFTCVPGAAEIIAAYLLRRVMRAKSTRRVRVAHRDGAAAGIA